MALTLPVLPIMDLPKEVKESYAKMEKAIVEKDLEGAREHALQVLNYYEKTEMEVPLEMVGNYAKILSIEKSEI